MTALRPDTSTVVAPARTARITGLVAAVLGLVICWLLVAPQQYAWDELTGGQLPYAPDAWLDGYQSMYDGLGDPLGLSPYYFWGKFAFLFFAAALVAARALPKGTCRRSRVGRTVLLVALAVGLVGDVIAYWGGTSGDLTTMTGIGFVGLEMPAMLAMTVALVLYGLGLAHDGLRPRWVPWALVVGAVAGIPFSILVITYIPHGILFAVTATIAVTLAGTRDMPRDVVRPGGDDDHHV